MRDALGLPPSAPPADDAVVMSLLCAALYPQLAFVASGGGGVLHARDPSGGSAPQPASVHPSSVNSRVGAEQWSSLFLVFHERVRTSKVYVRDCSPVPPLALLLFAGGRMDACRQQGSALLVDGW